jgi:Lon protease (S16) C-terminal proteolytic domain
MRAVRALGWLVVGLGVLAAVLVHRRFPWIPLPYLLALVGLPAVAVVIARHAALPRPVRWGVPTVAALLFVALCPVPWMKAQLDRPPGSAWRLDDRLVINGTTIDPPGTWYWLTAGRPPMVAEVVASWLTHDADAPTSMHDGRRALRPAVTEPAAAAVGLRKAGWPVDFGVIVEVSDPIAIGLPDRAMVAAINGKDVTTRSSWDLAVAAMGDHNSVTTTDGDHYEFAGTRLPFRRVDVIDVAAAGLDVAVGGRLARTWAGSWFRDLALGSSHGLMVALVSYVYGSGEDLAAGRAIAGTGTIRGDGSVGSIGGLWAKATAARRIGADVLLFPAHQEAQLDGFDPGGMALIPVASLDEAITALEAGGP